MLVIAGAMLAAAAVLLAVTPHPSDPVRPADWWAFALVALAFAALEHLVFHIEFEREAVAFSLSEVPTAFALVFLSPFESFVARVPLSVLVLLVVRRMVHYKLVFNAALMALELAAVTVLFRWIIEVVDERGHVAIVLTVLASLLIVTPFSSFVVALAISRFEGGGVFERTLVEMRSTWWLYPMNASLGAITVSLAMVEPWLSAVAVLPVAGIWAVLQNFGGIGQRLRDLDAVHGFAGRVGRSLQLDEIGSVAAAESARLLHGDAAALVRFDAVSAPVHTFGSVPFELPASPDAPGWAALVARESACIVDARELRARGIDVSAPNAEAIVAPVADQTGLLALLVVVKFDRPPLRFAPHDVARAQNLAEQLAASLRKGLLHERLEWEARHDALTGLPARTLFERHVAEVVRRPRPGLVSSVLMLDLDRFKEVNDTLGHHAGDDLLVEFARRASALLGPDDVLARLAGDEFAILCHRPSHDDVLAFAQACVVDGGRPVTLDGLEIVVTVSIGVAEVTPTDTSPLQPMRRADIAMYNAKWQRSGVELYRDEIDRRTPARLSMLGDLRTAIEHDELDVVYQPKLDLATGVIVGVEALVRWEHARRGVVAPTEFVRVAEDTGLIKDLTNLVLARGIADLRRFHDDGLLLGLAVNLSTHDLFDTKLPSRVRTYLEANGVEPGVLTLEITESSLFVDAPRTRATIDDLHSVGLRMAVDDFGTGYSSLSYLRRLPVHELKIDQSFVARMLTDQQDEVIVRSTIDLGHNLGLRVVAEGVETTAVLERLRDVGCDVAQGYCIAQAMPASELVEWVRRAEAARLTCPPTGWLVTFA